MSIQIYPEGVRMTQKRKIIQEIVNVSDYARELHSGAVKTLLDEGKITSGSYYYLLAPSRNWGYAKFYGHDWAGKSRKSMINHSDKYNTSEFISVLKDIKKHIEVLELVIKMQKHDLEVCMNREGQDL